MLANCAACRVAHHMRGVDIQGIHDRDQIIRHMFGTVDDFSRRTLAAAAMVMRDHAKIFGKLLYLIGPEYPATAKSCSQQKIGAAAGYLHMDFGIADVDPSRFC